MPGMNGLEATNQIKKIHPKIPIIIQTAHAMYNDRNHSFEAGCDDYITKPIKSNTLFAVLNKYL